VIDCVAATAAIFSSPSSAGAGLTTDLSSYLGPFSGDDPVSTSNDEDPEVTLGSLMEAVGAGARPGLGPYSRPLVGTSGERPAPLAGAFEVRGSLGQT
jgi:hypothetical protein